VEKQLNPFARHVFTAEWQYKQYLELKTNLPPKWVLMVLDFAENYRTFFQQEIQSAHWCYNQVTIHPIVTFYRCLTCQNVVQEAIIYVSADLVHDAHAVRHFVADATNFLLTERKLELEHIVQFSDGCAVQYKSKRPFHDVSQSKITTDRNFYGARHGKGPSDGLSAVAKQACTRAVKSGEVVIQDARDMYCYLKKDMCNNRPELHGTEKCSTSTCYRTFVYVDKLVRSEGNEELIALKGTRLLHSVASIGEAGKVVTRDYSCYCQHCIDGECGKCDNSGVASKWTPARLTKAHAKPV
jgi:hypothetical protein